MSPVLQFDDVAFSRGKRRLFENLNLALGDTEQGTVTALVGVSGIGKSTFLRMVAGLEKPTAGQIHVNGDTATISFLSQEPVIFEHLSARDNALYLLQARKQLAGSKFQKLASDLRLNDILKSPRTVSSLSGGERQRLAILRALSTEPRILLLDEPCAGLDPALRGSVIDGLQRAISSTLTTVLYVTHHIDEIVLSSDNVLFFGVPSDVAGDVRLIISTAEEFLTRPPTIDSAKFALFPRCNVVTGHVHGDQFVTSGHQDVSCESIAFLPSQAHLIKPANGHSTMEWNARRRSGIVWLDVNGESIAVSSTNCKSAVAKFAMKIQPGALVYDCDGNFHRVLDNPLDLVSQ